MLDPPLQGRRLDPASPLSTRERPNHGDPMQSRTPRNPKSRGRGSRTAAARRAPRGNEGPRSSPPQGRCGGSGRSRSTAHPAGPTGPPAEGTMTKMQFGRPHRTSPSDLRHSPYSRSRGPSSSVSSADHPPPDRAPELTLSPTFRTNHEHDQRPSSELPNPTPN